MTDQEQGEGIAASVSGAQMGQEPGDPNVPGTSLSERARELVSSLEHSMKHNAPVSNEQLRELKALLGVSGE
ncbi:hypothetical protein [Bradyrhizobium betae]|uniref:Uncharacterized protein n=1 Tax=Bradyrhizobium betae TaxID=244734 RepID=A0A5P6NYR5_9BRAD|nr:hypothetical protein [Bradyrhizobium betae]MCS3725489.1 hypothetical protein [Bradyrhizobium betae]QFI71221.1 hypothetical protein F8237_01825 [Bradyrhizobium betae]